MEINVTQSLSSTEKFTRFTPPDFPQIPVISK